MSDRTQSGWLIVVHPIMSCHGRRHFANIKGGSLEVLGWEKGYCRDCRHWHCKDHIEYLRT